MMIYWRFKKKAPCEWRFGYRSHVKGNLYRMGRWNGDTSGGVIVDITEIEEKSA